MITKIDYLKDFGIYKNFTWDNAVIDFKKKNIFYGWNYSGKTTLSRVFSSLRDEEIFSDYNKCDFKITTIDNNSYTKSNLQNFPFRTLVFNSDYVNENLRWGIDDKINAIYFQVGEDAKNAKRLEELESLIHNINGNDIIIGKKTPFLENVSSFEIFEQKLFTDESKRIKNDVFSSLIEFNKRNFKKQIPLVSQNLNGFILKKTILSKLSKIVKIEEPKLEVNLIEYELKINDIILEVNKLLIKEPNKSDVISVLEGNSTALEWVKKGLQINSPKEKCLFCDNIISKERVELLNKFYINESSKLRDTSKEIFDKIDEEITKVKKLNFPNSVQDINEGYQEQYLKHKKSVDAKIRSYLKKLESVKKQLFLKVDKNIYKKIEESKLFNVENLDNEIKKINKVLIENNNFSKDFKEIIKSERLKYINHLVAKFLKENKYKSKRIKHEKALKEIEKLDEKINEYNKEIIRINALKSDAEEGCQQLNYFVQSFLGKEDIKVQYNKENKTFNLYRGLEIAKNLSEGEKMAISFSHFMVTLKSIESQNKLKDLIIFIDDPMSSLDGNHIFQINALLKDFLYEKIPNHDQPSVKMWNQKCLQLFISTHNFDFFNLLKELPTAKGFSYERRNNKKESRYFISRKINNSSIENLPKVYDSFKSEYHFLFKEINDFTNSIGTQASTEKLLLMPNILRRFLEMYTLAKYPSKDEVDDRATEIFGALISKRICKPFHYFSHFNNIDRIGKQSELLSDIGTACKELIKQIKKDKKHYKALQTII